MLVNTVTKFLQEVHSEMSKVTWPTKEDFVGSLFVTLILVVAFAIYLALLDIAFSMLARFMFQWYGG
ncbi:preprotein translocase subunit SecE [bacterium]|nr:MAG: preprotein translocase subunit SecE [bacterium]QQR61511.1 MAG: preprotein translocase subunit SecE [bacterium]QQR62961.1 MAG: preprotein translocase subunit SecE [bacterium]